jgi:hypothetical protein
MLINHTAELGFETVESVTVFSGDGPAGVRTPSLVFEIKNI